MSFLGFGSPKALTAGYDFSTAATDINDGPSGFSGIAPFTSGGGFSTECPPEMHGMGGFNLPGSAAQNIITDPNAVGLATPGMTMYGPAPLTNPLGGAYGMGSSTGLNMGGGFGPGGSADSDDY